MHNWITRIAVGAALLAGCTGKIGSGAGPGSSSGAGSTTGLGTGTAGTTGVITTGTAGTTGTVTTGTAGTTGTVVTPPPVDPTVCVAGVPATSQLPRLTRAEYDNTIRDLLGIDVQPSSMLAPDTLGSVDQRAWDGFQTAADSLRPR